MAIAGEGSDRLAVELHGPKLAELDLDGHGTPNIAREQLIAFIVDRLEDRGQSLLGDTISDAVVLIKPALARSYTTDLRQAIKIVIPIRLGQPRRCLGQAIAGCVIGIGTL